jgi:hypothetical protein
MSTTLPLAQRISQGEARLDNQGDCEPYLDIRIKVGHTLICKLPQDDAPVEDFNAEQHANARFIIEAFNVTHETGLTPRQLADALTKRESIPAAGTATVGEIPTPRTDAMRDYCHEACNADDIPVGQVLDSHEQLERELAEAMNQRDALASDCERFRYAIDQTAFYFAGTSSQYITDILSRVLNGESVEEIRASNAKALATLEGRAE